jgi:hypothetical protein
VNVSGSLQCGWAGSFPVFYAKDIDELINCLAAFVKKSTPEQFSAWKRSIPPLQLECKKISQGNNKVAEYGAILEYILPDCSKRADAILLISGAVLVIELKGDGNESEQYLEQAADYSRRLYWSHKLCGEANVKVHTLVVSYGREGAMRKKDWITLTNVDQISETIKSFDRPTSANPIEIDKFISPEACQPSPSLVKSVREYYLRNKLPRIKRIDEITSCAIKCIVDQIYKTHQSRGRKLILLGGVPGGGKTYVGMQIAHDSFLDELSEPMSSGEKPTAPAVYLSGNRPLVDVLQYEMRQAGGEGAVFVRHVHEFMKRYSSKKSGQPPHHVMIFDEAQRAWDADQVRYNHDEPGLCSEPESFIRFAEKIPRWSVVMGLIGDGQQISYGEERGIELWAEAVTTGTEKWDVCGPKQYEGAFSKLGVGYSSLPELYLSKSVRFHFAARLTDWAAGLVENNTPTDELCLIARALKEAGYQLRITRKLAAGKKILWEKYQNIPDARFGLLASARDKALSSAVDLNRVSGKFFRAGPWYSDPEVSPSSCRRLAEAITEFSAQGLELDHTLLVWGTDFKKDNGTWSDSMAMAFQRKKAIKNTLQLRKNAYRVLLTRGREGVIICIPDNLPELNETYEYLLSCGCDNVDKQNNSIFFGT